MPPSLHPVSEPPPESLSSQSEAGGTHSRGRESPPSRPARVHDLYLAEGPVAEYVRLVLAAFEMQE